MIDHRMDRIRAEVAARLAARLREDQADGRLALVEQDRFALGHELIAEALQEEAEAALSHGRPVLSSEEEDALA